MYIIHHHSTVYHDGLPVMGQRECAGFRDHVGEEERLRRLAEFHDQLATSAPPEVKISGNLHDGYSYTAESTDGQGHAINIEVSLFIDQEQCPDGPPPPRSAPLSLVFDQAAEIVKGL